MQCRELHLICIVTSLEEREGERDGEGERGREREREGEIDGVCLVRPHFLKSHFMQGMSWTLSLICHLNEHNDP